MCWVPAAQKNPHVIHGTCWASIFSPHPLEFIDGHSYNSDHIPHGEEKNQKIALCIKKVIFFTSVSFYIYELNKKKLLKSKYLF